MTSSAPHSDHERDADVNHYERDASGTKNSTHFPKLTLHAMKCGSLPHGITVHDMLAWPAVARPRKRVSLEDQYLSSYAAALNDVKDAHRLAKPRLIAVPNSTCCISAADVIESHTAQVQFLKDVDNYKIDARIECPDAPLHHQKGSGKDWDKKFKTFVTHLPRVRPSRTVVMETAFHFVQSGLFNIPDTGE
eukprot:7959479-Karenia_brevis.AAC.1